jgi:TRAP transporter 4TM/12TM fusion protein
MFGVAYYSEQFESLILGLAIAVGFLILPMRRGTERVSVPWYDIVAALLALAVGCYMAVAYPSLVDLILQRPAGAVIPGAVLLVLLLEGTRRATGWPLVIIIVAFIIYGLLGNFVPGRLSGRPQSWDFLASYLAFDSNGVLGIPLAIAATIVVAFMFFGALLGATGGSQFFTDAALIGMGRFRGGPMKIAVLASALFGMISGSAVANVMTTGVVTIPMMKRTGFPAHKAGAIESVSATGGQLMPPVMGAAAFVMAEFLRIPYAAVALAALVPGLLYYFALFIQADLEAVRNGMTAADKADIPPLRPVLTGWHFPVGFALLVILLFSFNWLPERAAYFASVVIIITSVLFGYRGVRLKPRQFFDAFVQTGRSVVDIVLISAAAGIVIGILAVTGLSFNLTYALVQVGGGNVALLLVLSAVVCIILGMGLPTLGVYVLLAALVAPALIQMGIMPIAAHMFILYFGMMSMITPPVAMAAFAAASVAGSDPMRTGYAAVKFGWTAFVVPFLFVISPTLLLIGPPGSVILAVAATAVGVWLISVALAGYFLRHLEWPMRALFFLTGVAALIPADAFPGGVWTDVVGFVVGAALIGREIVVVRNQRRMARVTAT